MEDRSPKFEAALRDFRRARQRAILEQIIASLNSRSAELLPYDKVEQELKVGEPVDRGLERIPVSAIVGSVGRYAEFTRSFLPKRNDTEARWARVKRYVEKQGAFPPITVYKVDKVYFVLDGNHRVSVARQLGETHINAYVAEIKTKVPVPYDVDSEELDRQSRYAEFLDRTNLNGRRPDAELTITAPGQYWVLLEQIENYRRHLNQKQKGHAVSYEEAAVHWYDSVYLPVVHIIRQRGILRYFPGRTETDLFVWISRHREELAQELGWEVNPRLAADDLVTRFSPKASRVAKRITTKLLDAITPDPLEEGPPPGQWRAEHRATIIHEDRLFGDIMVPISGSESSWEALEQSIVVARREDAHLHGLHVLEEDDTVDDPAAQLIKTRFERRCEKAGIPGTLSFAKGNTARQICERSRYSDLIVLDNLYPPAPRLESRLTSGFGTLIRRCPRPIFALPGSWSNINRALLAFDGSPKATEAMFVSAYLAGKWGISLVVATSQEHDRQASDVLAQADEYLAAHDVKATLIREKGPAAHAIRTTALGQGCDLIIMGGYGHKPMLEVVLGSTVDKILRTRLWPVLICR